MSQAMCQQQCPDSREVLSLIIGLALSAPCLQAWNEVDARFLENWPISYAWTFEWCQTPSVPLCKENVSLSQVLFNLHIHITERLVYFLFGDFSYLAMSEPLPWGNPVTRVSEGMCRFGVGLISGAVTAMPWGALAMCEVCEVYIYK